MIKIEFTREGAHAVVETNDPDSISAMLEAAVDAIDERLVGKPRTARAPGDSPLASYRCHKVVKAAEILAVAERPLGAALLTLKTADGGRIEWRTASGWMDRYNFRQGDPDLGFFVEYEDGYTSWSPSKAFTEGYKRI